MIKQLIRLEWNKTQVSWKTELKFCCCLIAKLCLTYCDLMDSRMLGSSVLHYLQKFAQIHVH